jgi:hypothetical protein
MNHHDNGSSRQWLITLITYHQWILYGVLVRD